MADREIETEGERRLRKDTSGKQPSHELRENVYKWQAAKTWGFVLLQHSLVPWQRTERKHPRMKTWTELEAFMHDLFSQLHPWQEVEWFLSGELLSLILQASIFHSVPLNWQSHTGCCQLLLPSLGDASSGEEKKVELSWQPLVFKTIICRPCTMLVGRGWARGHNARCYPPPPSLGVSGIYCILLSETRPSFWRIASFSMPPMWF